MAGISNLGNTMLHFFVILCLCVWLRWTCAPLSSVPVAASTRALSSHFLAFSFGGIRRYSKRFSFWILRYFDHWRARSACRQRVTLLFLLALLSPCISSLAMFHGTFARVRLCLHFMFLWRRRCTLWIDFCADNIMVIKKMGVSDQCFPLSSAIMTNWPSSSGRMIPLHVWFLLWTITTVTIMKNIRTRARPIKQNLQFATCLLTMYIFNCCVGGTIARAQACVFTSLSGVHAINSICCIWWLSCHWMGVCYRNCTSNLLSSIGEYHHIMFPAFSSNQFIASRGGKRVLLWAEDRVAAISACLRKYVFRNLLLQKLSRRQYLRYIRVFAKVRFSKCTSLKIVPKAAFAVHFLKKGKNVLYRR